MLLAVDVGNSHTVAGIFKGEELVCDWRLKSDRDRTPDELAIRYHSLFQIAGIEPVHLNGFILSSVVPALEGVWLGYARKYLGNTLATPPITVNHTTKTGITVATEHPEEVGADRIVNAVAAWNRFQSHLIVIDFGTAITFDCVSADRKYLGGTILPGIGISLDALAARTAKLPRVDIDTPPQSVIGKTTTQAIRSGILHGFGGLIDRMVENISLEMDPQQQGVHVIGTGGMAELIVPYSKVMQEVDPYLTLQGLRLIYQANATAQC